MLLQKAKTNYKYRNDAKTKTQTPKKQMLKKKKHCISSKYSSSSPASLLWQLHMYTSHNLNYLCITSLEVFA